MTYRKQISTPSQSIYKNISHAKFLQVLNEKRAFIVTMDKLFTKDDNLHNICIYQNSNVAAMESRKILFDFRRDTFQQNPQKYLENISEEQTKYLALINNSRKRIQSKTVSIGKKEFIHDPYWKNKMNIQPKVSYPLRMINNLFIFYKTGKSLRTHYLNELETLKNRKHCYAILMTSFGEVKRTLENPPIPIKSEQTINLLKTCLQGIIDIISCYRNINHSIVNRINITHGQLKLFYPEEENKS